MTFRNRDLKILLMFYALCLGVQCLGQYFTHMSVFDWYPNLNRSPLTPSGPWFAAVWTTLYAFMAIAAWRVWHVIGILNSRPLHWWLITLFTGLLWSIVFFGHRNPGLGLIVLGFNWFACALTTHLFQRVNKTSGILMAIQLGWLTFALYLNFYITMHN